MPELLSKHPDVVLQVLKGSGFKCGGNEKPKILTHCPSDQFCLSPKGEFCVYGYKNMSQMTQISSLDLTESMIKSSGSFIGFLVFLLIIAFGIGMWLGNKFHSKPS